MKKCIEIVCRFAWRYLLQGIKDPESLDRFLCRHFLYESHELVKKTLGNRGLTEVRSGKATRGEIVD